MQTPFLNGFAVFVLLSTIVMSFCLDAQFHLFTAMVLDAQHNGIAVAWYLTSRSCTTSVESFLAAIQTAAREIKSDFKFGSVGCDDADDEINAVRCPPSLAPRLVRLCNFCKAEMCDASHGVPVCRGILLRGTQYLHFNHPLTQ